MANIASSAIAHCPLKILAVTIDGFGRVNHNEKKLEEIVRRQHVIAVSAIEDFPETEPHTIRYHDVGEDGERDHCVLIVGFETKQGIDYWKCKSFWNPDKYGDKGYFKIERTTNNPNRHPEGNGAGGIAVRCYYPIKVGFNM